MLKGEIEEGVRRLLIVVIKEKKTVVSEPKVKQKE